MAYTKTNWKDHVAEFPNRYKMTNNPDGTVIIEKREGNIAQDGTPVNAANLNKIEDELERQSHELDEHTSRIQAVESQLESEDYTKRIEAIEDELSEKAPTSITMKHGLQVVDVPQDTPFNVSDIRGRTLVNLLGRDGNCEDTSKWVTQFSALDNRRVIGNYGMLVSHPTQGQNAIFYKIIKLDTTKYYYMSGYALSVLDVAFTIGTSIGIPIGGGMVRFSPNSDTKFKYGGFKFKPTVSDLYITALVYGKAGVTSAGVFDALSLYEISAAEYAAIDNMTSEQIAQKYPYVDDMKPIQNPYAIRYGRNLFRPITNWQPYYTAGTTGKINGPYNVVVTKTDTGQYSYLEDTFLLPEGSTITGSVDIDVINFVGTTTGGYLEFMFFDSFGNFGGSFRTLQALESKTLSVTNNVPAGYPFTKVRLVVHETAKGAFTFKNFMVNIGTQPLSFEPQNNDYLFIPGKFHSNVDRTVADDLIVRDGKVSGKLKWFEEVVLDGSFNYNFAAGYTGYKTFKLPMSGHLFNTSTVVKYDGKILGKRYSGVPPAAADEHTLDTTDFYISIANVDSGWGDGYNPTQAEIQAYFYGWKMFCLETNAANGLGTYNGTGTKKWTPLRSFDGTKYYGVYSGTGTPSDFPNTSNVNQVYIIREVAPYKLVYQRATPIEEPITVEGGISLKAGANTLEIGEGVIIREAVTPKLNSGNDSYQINVNDKADAGYSPLLNRLDRFIEIYKNQVPNKTAWKIDAYYPYGNYRALCFKSNYDPTAAYSVTYLVLDRHTFTAPLDTITGEYCTNIGGVVAELSQDMADMETRLSVVETVAANANKIDLGKMRVRINAGKWEYNDGSGWKVMGGGVKNVQRGTASSFRIQDGSVGICNVTIAPVDLSKTSINVMAEGGAVRLTSGGIEMAVNAGGILTSPTNLQLKISVGHYVLVNGYTDVMHYVDWEVIESN